MSHSTNTRKILTGATGSIGAHTLYELLNDTSVSKVYCFTRRENALKAVLQSLLDKELHVTAEQASRIVALNTDLEDQTFGLGDNELIPQMLDSVTQIIHAAWPVNFNLPLRQFEEHIRGLHNLIQFSLSVHQPEPAVLMFCSSVSTALASSSPSIHEEPLRLDGAYMGYGRSKLIGEHIVSAARRTGAKTYSLRIGQVSGHSKKGLWNDSEALPLMIRSALTLGALPELQETCSWLPVDKLAATIVELTRSCAAPARPASPVEAEYVDDSIYNVCNSRAFSWSALLASLENNGFRFQTVSFEEWMRLLRESEERGEVEVNPAVKLVGHYEEMYGRDSVLGQKTFLTEKSERDSLTLRNGRLRIIEDGILNCYVRDWTTRWTVSC